MDRLLAGAGGTLALTTYDANGAVSDVNGTNTPTVVVKDSAAVTVSTIAGTRTSTGLYGAVIPVTYTTLDTFEVIWTWPNAATRTTQFEVVGAFLYADAEFRAFDAGLASTTTYPTTTVRDIRETVEDRFAKCARVSFTRRGMRDLLDGDGSCSLFTTWPQVRRVVSLKIDGLTQDVANVKSYPTGRIELVSGTFPWGRQNVEVLYEHGYDPPPGPVHDAGLRYGRSLIVKGVFDDMSRATSIQTEVGLMRISQASQGKVGIPEIDAVLADYGYTGALIG